MVVEGNMKGAYITMRGRISSRMMRMRMNGTNLVSRVGAMRQGKRGQYTRECSTRGGRRKIERWTECDLLSQIRMVCSNKLALPSRNFTPTAFGTTLYRPHQLMMRILHLDTSIVEFEQFFRLVPQTPDRGRVNGWRL